MAPAGLLGLQPSLAYSWDRLQPVMRIDGLEPVLRQAVYEGRHSDGIAAETLPHGWR